MKFRTTLRLLAKVVVTVALLFELGAMGLHAEVRTLTDKQGRSLKAEVLSVDGDSVSIRREDGQTFSLSLSSLSDDDQRSLKEWAKQQVSVIPAGGIELQISRGKFDTQKQDDGGVITSEEQWGYTVTLFNRTSKPVTGARVDYILFVKPDAQPGKDSTPVPLKKKAGSKQIDTVGFRNSVNFRTSTITIYKQQLKAGWVWSKTGNNAVVKDTLYGIWIRAYVGDQLVDEICSPDNLSKTETWVAE